MQQFFFKKCFIMTLVKRRNYTLKCLDGGLLSKESISGACLKITQTILIFLLLSISRIFRLKLTKIRDYMRYVCIQFMAVTLWSIELYSDTLEYKKVTKKMLVNVRLKYDESSSISFGQKEHRLDKC